MSVYAKLGVHLETVLVAAMPMRIVAQHCALKSMTQPTSIFQGDPSFSGRACKTGSL
jgi:hypothetical protein